MNHSSTDLVYRGSGSGAHRSVFLDHHPGGGSLYHADLRGVFHPFRPGRQTGYRHHPGLYRPGVAGVLYSPVGAGPGVLLGNTGGYILGFLAMGLTYWGITALLGETRKIRFLGLLLGLVVLFMPLALPGSFFFTPETREIWGSSRFLAGASSPL